MNQFTMAKSYIIATIIALLLLFLFLGCNLSQHKDLQLKPPPSPVGQLYEAAKKSNWLVTLSIVGIAASVFALMNGGKLGIAGIVSCSVSMFMALAVARFALPMAVLGMVGSSGLCVASILVRRKALFEIVKGVQVFRDTHDASPTGDDLDNSLRSEIKKGSTRE